MASSIQNGGRRAGGLTYLIIQNGTQDDQRKMPSSSLLTNIVLSPHLLRGYVLDGYVLVSKKSYPPLSDPAAHP